MTSKTAVFGIFPSRAKAESCVNSLMEAGFESQDISILMSSPDSIGELATRKTYQSARRRQQPGRQPLVSLAELWGLLAGIGVLAIPGLGPFIAAGPIMGALAGLGAGAATGGIIGAFVGMEIPEYEAKRYEGRLKNGGILFSVHCDDANFSQQRKRYL